VLTLPAVGETTTVVIAPADLSAASGLVNYGDCTGGLEPEGGEKIFDVTPAVTAVYTFATDDTFSGGAFDSVLAITDAACAVENTYLACSDDVDAAADQYFSAFTIGLDAGTDYVLVVDSYTSFEPTTLTVTAAQP
jgi:hypothetical protein